MVTHSLRLYVSLRLILNDKTTFQNLVSLFDCSLYRTVISTVECSVRISIVNTHDNYKINAILC